MGCKGSKQQQEKVGQADERQEGEEMACKEDTMRTIEPAQQEQELQVYQHAADKPLGVRLSAIEGILQEVKEKGLGTTTDACNDVIKPKTLAHKCAFVDLIAPEFVAPATCFISHAWSYDMDDVVDVMRQYEDENPNTHFWFDLVINNQHDTSERPFEWWCNTFQKSIEEIGTVVLVLAPWDKPTPLRRSWCLFEIMCSMNAGDKVNLQIRLPTDQQESFVKGLRDEHESALNALIGVKTEDSEAFSASDKANIFKAVEASIGFHNLNSQINDQMRRWFLEQGEKAVSEIEKKGVDVSKDAEFGALCNQLGSMQLQLDDLDKAQRSYSKALEIYKAVFGDEHADTATAYNNMGNVFDEQGDYEKALEFYGNALAVYRKVNGNDHTDTAGACNNIGIVYGKSGDLDKALEYYGEALEIKRKIHGEDHPETGQTYNNMAIVFNLKGDYDKALEYFSKDLEISMKTLGSDHPDTAATHNNMGAVLEKKGEVEKALEHYRKALEIRRKVHGDNHPDTAQTYNNIGVVYDNQRDFDNALEYFGKALDVKIKAFGSDHPSTADTCWNIALVYSKMGNIAKQLEMWQKAHAAYLATFGPDHEDTIDTGAKINRCKLVLGMA